MGIKDFYPTLEDICPNAVISDVPLSKFSGYRIAIDVSIFLYKFVKTAGSDRWFDTFILFVCILKRNGIKCVFIFDGPNPPIEKKSEQDRRRAEGAKITSKLAVAKALLAKIVKENIPTSKQLSPELKEEAHLLLDSTRSKAPPPNYSDVFDVAQCLKVSIGKWEKQSEPIKPEYSMLAKEFIDIMGLSYLQADGEAETLCAHLCRHGEVDAVLSEDTDVLVYGTPIFMSKIDIAKGTVTVIRFEDICEQTKFTEEEFRDLCILLTCDYNDSVKGFPPAPGCCTKHAKHVNNKKSIGIGAKAAVCMIDVYRTLEEVEKHLEDAEPLNYKRCRELFTLPPFDITDFSKRVLPISTSIDEERLQVFLKRINARTNLKYVLDTWKPVEIVFE